MRRIIREEEPPKPSTKISTLGEAATPMSVQRGLESGGYRPAPLVINPARGVNSEHSIRALHEWLREAMSE